MKTSNGIIGTTEAADILGLTPSRVRQLGRAGEIPSTRVGKCFGFERREIMAFSKILRSRSPRGRPRTRA